MRNRSVLNTAIAVMALSHLVYGSAACAQARVNIGRFSAGEIAGWQSRTFDDVAPSDYDIVVRDGRRVLGARCDHSGSLFGVRQEIDLDKTPVLHWSWKIDHVFTGIDERSRAGDDFAARIYVVIDGGLLKWRTRAINYVWAATGPVGANWPNPFTDAAMMVVAQHGSPPADNGGWAQETRDVKADFARFYGLDASTIDGVAVMTDCDNHGGANRAYYGDIYFTGP